MFGTLRLRLEALRHICQMGMYTNFGSVDVSGGGLPVATCDWGRQWHVTIGVGVGAVIRFED